jgi:hypothetical protein
LVTTCALLVGVAWWVVGLRPFSAAATVAVLVTGVAAMVWGARSPRRRRPAVDRQSRSGWLVLASAAAAWELAAFVQHPRDEHPTLSSLTNALLDSRPARAAAFVAWLVGAAALARR